METICIIHEIYKAIEIYGKDFEKKYSITLNEAMVLCSLTKGELSATQIVHIIGMTNSHTSKIIRSAEEKGLITRIIGKEDKRKMYFCLTSSGKEYLEGVKCGDIKIPEILQPIFKLRCNQHE